MSERFAMSEFKPQSLTDKRFRLEEEIRQFDSIKQPLIDRKREIENQLTDVNTQLKDWLPNDQYAIIMKSRKSLTSEKFTIEEEIRAVNKKQREKLNELNLLNHQISKLPNSKVQEMLIELRDKYTAFSADTTRVSSMRAMSSKFVEEILTVLKHVKESGRF